MQRRRRPDLNINIVPTTTKSSRGAHDDGPQTPPNPSRRSPLPSKGNLKAAPSSRALKQLTPTTHTAKHARGAFLEDKTPTTLEEQDEADKMPAHNASANGNGGGNRSGNGNGKRNGNSDPSRTEPRDSHDLSLSPRNITRDSLVTNMLLSLDQFSMGQMNPPRQTYEDLFGPGPDTSRTLTSRTTRPNGHEYSYSSDFDGTDDASRVSSQFSRGRRSNSSSNFQSTLGRINSMREPGQKSQPGTPRHAHSRGGRGSKSSSSNSVDAGYAQVLSSQRWAHGFGGGRSSNFDHGVQGQPLGNPPAPSTGTLAIHGQPQNPWHIDFSNSFFSGSNSNNLDDDFDAAPTPTVPGGPRRLNTVPSLPTLPSSKQAFPPPHSTMNGPKSPARIPAMERKRSTRSSRSATVGRNAQPKTAPSRDAPPLPVSAFDIDSAPAPHVGYEKSKEPVQGVLSSGPAQNQQKEKVGFFRRVFGTRKDTASDQVAYGAGANSANSQGGGGGTQMKSQSTPPSRDSQHSSHSHVSPQPHGTLQKKSSSFFRRQKKVVAQPEPPLPPPPPLPQTVVPPPRLLSPKPEWSPALTRSMAPFLGGSGGPSPTKDTAAPDGSTTADTAFGGPQKGPIEPDPSCGSHELLATPTCKTNEEPAAEPVSQMKPKPKSRSKLTPRDSSPVMRTSRIETPTRQPPDPPNPQASGFQPKSLAGDTRTRSFLNDNSDSDGDAGDEREEKSRRGSKSKLEKHPKTERKTKNSKLVLPIEGAVLEGREGSSIASKSATSLPSVTVEGAEPSPSLRPSPRPSPRIITTGGDMGPPHKAIDEPEFVVGDPTDDDRQKAQKIYDGNEDFIQKERAAAWMGEEGPVRQRTLRAYMTFYDFTSRSIVSSLRDVCGRLVLKAETQQVDRILSAFAKRWCECNPAHGFKATDVVHTVCYSVMLLNTDLHMADIEQKMTRSQFVKNTIGTIRQALADAAPDAFGRQTILPGKSQGLSPEDGRSSVDQDRPPPNNYRHSFLAGLSTREGEPDDCGPLVNTPFEGSLRAWEAQVETVLKDTYTSIRDERLPLFGADPSLLNSSQTGLSVIGLLKRTPSVLSKAPSEGHGSTRGRNADQARLPATLRWTSKSRSRARVPFAPPNGGFSSSRTSFDDGNSIWSPTVSSATRSRYSLGRTQTSMSIDSVGSGYANGNFQQSIGFANALSQAIIREDAMGASLLSLSNEDLSVGKPLLEDESLELAGPPWVKEGRVIHKHHLDGIDKRAKDRNWTEVFAVVQKGSMSLFSFAPNKSLGKKSRSRGNTGHGGAGGGKNAVVGGGNWQENATNLGTFSLKQTLASALPPPGYSSTRLHVWALSLPTGAVHLFQVGTPEISREFVTTANYWSARLSTHPLVGGISNIEYGWSEAIVNNPLVTAIVEAAATTPGSNGSGSRPGSAAAVGRPPNHQSKGSMHSRASSFRSRGSLDFVRTRSGSVQSASQAVDALSENGGGGGSGGGVSYGSLNSSGGGRSGGGASAKLPGDKIHIAEWRPPAQSLRPSPLPESEQLVTLTAYVGSIEEELRQHNALRSPMLLAFSPRGGNAAKAMGNWQRKSEYLLRESVKYRTYVDALHEAAARKEEVYAAASASAAASAAAAASPSLPRDGE